MMLERMRVCLWIEAKTVKIATNVRGFFAEEFEGFGIFQAVRFAKQRQETMLK